MYHYFFKVLGYFAMDNGEAFSLKQRIGQRVLDLRTAKGYGVREFALLADVEHHQIINIEKGRTDMRVSTLYKIAVGLGITLSELLEFE